MKVRAQVRRDSWFLIALPDIKKVVYYLTAYFARFQFSLPDHGRINMP